MLFIYKASYATGLCIGRSTSHLTLLRRNVLYFMSPNIVEMVQHERIIDQNEKTLGSLFHNMLFRITRFVVFFLYVTS